MIRNRNVIVARAKTAAEVVLEGSVSQAADM